LFLSDSFAFPDLRLPEGFLVGALFFGSSGFSTPTSATTFSALTVAVGFFLGLLFGATLGAAFSVCFSVATTSFFGSGVWITAGASSALVLVVLFHYAPVVAFI
jgi:hypothetical protein